MVWPITLGNLALNSVYRFAPPFLGPISRDLGVSIAAAGVALSVGEMAGLFGPAFGRWVDRTTEKRGLLGPLALVAAGGFAAALAPSIWTYGIALAALVVAANVYVTARSAWIGERTPFAERGRVMGLVETSWAGALLVVIPLLAVVVAASSWRAGYAIAAAGCLASLWWLARRLGPDDPLATATRAPSAPVEWRRALPIATGFGLLMASSLFVTVVFGVWLEEEFDYSSRQVGAVAFLLGGAEMFASLIAIRLTDRLGKARSIIGGLLVMTPACVALALVHSAELPAIALLFVFVLGFEFSVVSALSLLPELQPSARASVVGIALGFGTIGRGVASLGGTWLFDAHGMASAAAAAAVCAAATVGIFAMAPEPERAPVSAP